MSIRIAPSILSADFGRLAEEIRTVDRAGAHWIHVDVMDGHFVPNITLGPALTAAARAATDLPLDVHLMIENPDAFVDEFADAGASILTVHQETCPHLHRTVQGIHDRGVKAGVALNPATPVESLRDIAPDLDLVLVMSVNPGFGGQAFIPGSIDRIRRLRTLLDETGSRAIVEVDGGVQASNARELVDAGAQVLVAGSAIYGHGDGPAAGVEALRTAVRGG